MHAPLNCTVLMSGVAFFDDTHPINPYMDARLPVDRARAQAEHDAIRDAFTTAGIQVIQVAPPPDCQDGVYTANWALVRGDAAVLARLPNARKGEEAYAERMLTKLGKRVVHVPKGLRFSGQGDALPCGDLLFAGQGYRADAAAQTFAAHALGFELIQLQTIPLLDTHGRPVINQSSGWADSFFYDIDLAMAVLHAPANGERGLIAWCPAAFMPESQKIMRALTKVDKIEISLKEAQEAFACNLVSTGETVIMSDGAPHLKAALESRGFAVLTPDVQELLKGGGFIRCTSLSLA
ncbi:MAG TPA: hypothetical protein VLG11_06145 [Candidatus Saccharimonadales bacterium]|nr:hypothetical protein [Candidatus Saccharimonadales bacterium]